MNQNNMEITRVDFYIGIYLICIIVCLSQEKLFMGIMCLVGMILVSLIIM